MIYSISIFVIVSSCLYWVYKKLRAPMYEPGMVAQALASTNQDLFDDPSLYSQTTKSKWVLPNNIELFYFPPGKLASGGPNKNSGLPRRPILCLHGGPSIAPPEPWKLCDQLSDAYLYHSRGCGQSTRPLLEVPSKSMWPGVKILEETLGIGAQVADVERIRRRLDVPQLDLVGHSYGALIATLYASEFPHHVRSLTLLAPAALLILPPPKGVPDFFDVMGDRIRAQKHENTELYVAEYEAFKKRYFDFSKFAQETEETLQQKQIDFAMHYGRAEALGATGPTMALPSKDLVGGMATFAQFLSMGLDHNYIPACKRLLDKANVEIPVAIVHGANDMMPEISTRKYLEIFPHASFEVIPGEGHFLFDHSRVVEIVKETMGKANSKD
jgi:proline iminopeptidase